MTMNKYRITAEHTKGKSVGHPCVDGVYSDPTDSFECEVFAADEDEAERKAQTELDLVVDASDVCKCRRHLQPGSDSWLNSVAFRVQQLVGQQPIDIDDARLRAAAPAMYEALKQASAYFDHDEHYPLAAVIDAALAQADGRNLAPLGGKPA